LPFDGPAAGVGVEDEEALEDMDGRFIDSGGWGIMRETKGIDSGPGGQGDFKKEKKREW